MAEGILRQSYDSTGKRIFPLTVIDGIISKSDVNVMDASNRGANAIIDSMKHYSVDFEDASLSGLWVSKRTWDEASHSYIGEPVSMFTVNEDEGVRVNSGTTTTLTGNVNIIPKDDNSNSGTLQSGGDITFGKWGTSFVPQGRLSWKDTGSNNSTGRIELFKNAGLLFFNVDSGNLSFGDFSSGNTITSGLSVTTSQIKHTGNAVIGGSATIGGSAAIGNLSSKTGDLTVGKDVTIGRNASIDGTLKVGGGITFNGLLTANKDASIKSRLYVHDGSIVILDASNGGVKTYVNTTVGKDLTVTGKITASNSSMHNFIYSNTEINLAGNIGGGNTQVYLNYRSNASIKETYICAGTGSTTTADKGNMSTVVAKSLRLGANNSAYTDTSIVLMTNAEGSPSILFQKGTYGDSNTDWRLIDDGGKLKFQYRGNGGTFKDSVYLNDGKIYIFGSDTSVGRYISSDSSTNVFLNVGNTTPLVASTTEVRRGSAAANNSINLGSSTYPWNKGYFNSLDVKYPWDVPASTNDCGPVDSADPGCVGNRSYGFNTSYMAFYCGTTSIQYTGGGTGTRTTEWTESLLDLWAKHAFTDKVTTGAFPITSQYDKVRVFFDSFGQPQGKPHDPTSLYALLKRVLINVSTANGITVQIKGASIKKLGQSYNRNSDYTIDYGTFDLRGNPGQNSIPLGKNGITFGAYTQTDHIGSLCFEFTKKEMLETTHIHSIHLIGTTVWESNGGYLARLGHIYDWDINQTACFPNDIVVNNGKYTQLSLIGDQDNGMQADYTYEDDNTRIRMYGKVRGSGNKSNYIASSLTTATRHYVKKGNSNGDYGMYSHTVLASDPDGTIGTFSRYGDGRYLDLLVGGGYYDAATAGIRVEDVYNTAYTDNRKTHVIAKPNFVVKGPLYGCGTLLNMTSGASSSSGNLKMYRLTKVTVNGVSDQAISIIRPETEYPYTYIWYDENTVEYGSIAFPANIYRPDMVVMVLFKDSNGNHHFNIVNGRTNATTYTTRYSGGDMADAGGNTLLVQFDTGTFDITFNGNNIQCRKIRDIYNISNGSTYNKT